MPKSRTRHKKGHPTARPHARWLPSAAISSRDPSGLPDILFPADVTGAPRPDFVGDELDFVVASPDGTEIRRVTLRFERRWATTAALDAWGFDTTKALAAHIRVQRSGTWQLDLRTAADPLHASQALLVLELIKALVPPNAIALAAASDAPGGYSALDKATAPGIPGQLETAVTYLARLEEYVGEAIALPETFTEQSLEDLRVAAQLLSGETEQGTWDEMTWPVTAAQARALASGPLSDDAADLEVTRAWDVDLGDSRVYRLYPVLARLHSVRVRQWPQTNGLDDDAQVNVILEPADEDHGIDLRLSHARGPQGPPTDQVMTEDDPQTVVSPDVYDDLLASLDEPSEAPPALVKAAARLRAIRA